MICSNSGDSKCAKRCMQALIGSILHTKCLHEDQFNQASVRMLLLQKGKSQRTESYFGPEVLADGASMGM
jgi:hypothetical protein